MAKVALKISNLSDANATSNTKSECAPSKADGWLPQYLLSFLSF